jgi:hypothetical protein
MNHESKFAKTALWVAHPLVQTWFNGFFALVWLIIMPLTLIFPIFRSSILWVAFISAWALFATHLGAWISALVNVKAERIDNRTEQTQHFTRIEEAEENIINILVANHEKLLSVMNKESN